MSTRSVAAALLVLEAIVIALGIPVAIAVSDVDASFAVPVGLGLALFAVVVAGLLRRPGGYALGWLVQALTIATGLVVPAMAVLGVVFGLLWLLTLRLGARIEADQAAYRATHPPADTGP